MFDRSHLVRALDVSHFQGTIDHAAVVASGINVVVVKATQGMGHDPLFEANRDGFLKAGATVLWYPFLTPDDDDDVIAAALAFTDGFVPMLDDEASGVGDDVVRRWQDAYEAKTNRQGFHYQGFFRGNNSRWPWWLAEYASQPRAEPWDGSLNPDWSKVWAAWQYSGNGRNAGISTPVDCDVLAMPLDIFRAFIATGTWPAWGKGSPMPAASPPAGD